MTTQARRSSAIGPLAGTEESLELEALRARDPQAVEKVVHAYHRHLVQAARVQGFSSEDAADLVSATWDTFFTSVGRFEGRSKVRTFLFGIFYNKVRELRRRRAKEFNEASREVENEEDPLHGRFDPVTSHWVKMPADPSRFAETAETLRIVQNCMEGLSEVHRMAFYLKEVEEEETDAICEVLGVNANHLGVLLYRARNKLRNCVEKKTLESGNNRLSGDTQG